MKLITNALKKEFAKVGEQSEIKNPLVLVKYFTPDANWTWFATEFYPVDRIFFGFVIGLDAEWGYFSLDELESVRGKLGLPVERDLHFSPKPFSEVKKALKL